MQLFNPHLLMYNTSNVVYTGRCFALNEDEILEIRSQIHQFIRLFGVLNPTETPCGYHLSLSQVLALQILDEKMPLTVRELAEQLYLERSTVSRLVDSLVKEGFVEREINERNRREILVSLTDHGRHTVQEVRNQSIDFFRSILENLSEEERKSILQGLHKFTSALAETRRNILEQ